MKYRTFKQNKLWRDKAVEYLEYHGSKIHWKCLDDAQFAQELKHKFMEEAQEVCDAQSKEALIEELADVLEVVAVLGRLHNFTLEEVVSTQKAKRSERGSFDGRKFVSHSEHPHGSQAEAYCLADPEKYPELK